MPEIEIVEPVEAVSTREYCRMRIRDHARRGVEEWLDVGRYVYEARQTFDIKKGRKRKGEPQEAYDEWLAETCQGIMTPQHAEKLRLMYERSQARYKELHRNEDIDALPVEELAKALTDSFGESSADRLDQALREQAGASKSKEKQEKPGDEIAAARQAKDAADDEKLAKAQEAAAEADRKRQRHYDNWQAAVQARKDEEQKRLDAVREAKAELAHLEDERETFSQNVRDSAAKQIAAYQARYNIPTIPEMFQGDPETFRKLLAKTTDERQREALKLLEEAQNLVGRMMQFEPEEAANGFLRWHNRDRAKENMERYEKWLIACMEEIRKQTSPGLRALS